MSGEPGRDALWVALLGACGASPTDVNQFNRSGYQEAARALLAAGATPSEIHRRAGLMRQAYTVPLTPKFIAAHYGEHAPRSSAAVIAGIFFHPDRCPVPCSGCAADRKGLAG